MKEEIAIKVLGKSWYKRLKNVLISPEFESLGKFIAEERKKYTVYPAKEDVFKAFKETPFDDVKVILLALDPYSQGSATGLSFAVPNHQLVPQPSLKKILDDIEIDVYGGFDFDHPTNFDLLHWAHSGVLLLNSALTVREKQAESHLKQWEFFTNEVINVLNLGHTGLIWILLGARAQEFESKIDTKNNHVIKSGHPASGCYSVDRFSGNHVFSKTNELLIAMNGESAKINW
jgi:uracil-DNA glycosylase